MMNYYNYLSDRSAMMLKKTWCKKMAFLLFFAMFGVLGVQAQVGVTVTNPANTTPNMLATYTSLNAALTDLNAVSAMSGPVTLTLASGSETAPAASGFTLGSATLNAVLSATNTVTVVASGTVTLNAAAGGTGTPASAAPDGIFKIVGADWVTLNGITFTDGNLANPATMEFGVGLFKLNATDGASNNTIRNCIFNMQSVNNASASGPMIEGSTGILMVNSTPTAAVTSLTPTAASGTNSNNKFYTNTINGGNYGIGLNGYAATTGVGPAPTAGTFLGDLNNDIGGSSALTGNTILNYGGAAAATNPAAGIRANNQWSINISYNTVNNNNGSGANHLTTLRGIYAQAGTSANANITNNTVTVKSAGTTTALTAIDNGIGGTALSNTININNNVITNCAYPTATTGTFIAINSAAIATNIIANGNLITNNSIGTAAVASSCAFYGIYNTSASTNFTANSNTITGVTLNNSYGSIYGIRAVTSVILVDGNTMSGFSIPNNAAGTSSLIYGYYNVSSPATETVTNNNINNFSINGSNTATTNAIYGIYNLTAIGAKNFSGNNINTLTFNSSGAGASGISGIRNSYNTIATISKNVIFGLSSSGATPHVSGLYLGSSSATTFNVSNNLISNLNTPQSTGHNLFGIFCGTVGTSINLYYNTVFLNGTSSGAGFSSSVVWQSSTTPTVRMNNNIFVNLSTPTGVGITSVYRRTLNTYASYSTASNNNLFYAGTPSAANVLFYDGTGYQTMATYTAQVTPRETSSFSETVSATPGVFFQSFTGPSTGSATNFLHLVNGLTTQAESGGIAISGITDDYEGNTRSATPDVGADEFIGTSPAPSITFNSITPSAPTLCAATSRTVSVTATTPSGTITGVLLNYSFNGVAQTGIAMTNTSGNVWTGTIPAATPSNAVVSWSATATSSLALTATYVSTATYADDQNIGAVTTATATPTTVCNGGTVTLKALVSSVGTKSVGPGATTSTGYPGAFYSNWSNIHTQHLITAAELSAVQLGAGNLTSVALNVTNAGTLPMINLSIKIGTTSATSMAAFASSAGFSTIYTNASYLPTVGMNTFTFSTPFYWDGTSNIIIEICHGNPSSSATMSRGVVTDLTSYISTAKTNISGTSSSATICGDTATNLLTYSERPQFTFAGTVVYPITGVTWTDSASNVVGTTNPLTISPTVSQAYTFNATSNTCAVTATTPLVTISPLVNVPTGTNSAQCGLQVPTASVADPNGFVSPTFNWYAASTGGTALQSSTATTYATAISVTTTFHVSVVNPTSGCESARTPVMVSVSTPDPVDAIVSDASICLGDAIDLSAVNTASIPFNSYTYSWSSTAGSGIATTVSGSPVTVTPTALGTYVYTVTATDGGCTTVDTVSVTVNALPSINLATPPTVCQGTSVTLTATSGTQAVGIANVGAGATTISGTTTGFGNPYNHWYGGMKTQFIYTKAELNAAGITAGNINSLAWEITTLGSATLVMNSYTINIGHTTQATATTTLITSGLTQVYSNATQSVTTGVNTYAFSAPFNWNNVDNIVISVSWSNVNSGNSAMSAIVKSDNLATNQTSILYADNTSAASFLAATTDTSTGIGTTKNLNVTVQRPRITLNTVVGVDATADYTWVWNPGNIAGNSISVTPASTTVYTVTATSIAGGCSASQPVTVTVNPQPIAPSGTNSAQCGAGIPTASVMDPNGFTSPTFKWYSAASGGTVLQSSAATTFTSSVAASITFYVAVVNPTTLCESTRTPVSVTFSAADPITITPSTTSPCVNSAFTLGASSANAAYVYTWTASPAAGSGIPTSVTGASVSVTPTTGGTFVYTVSGTDGNCTNTKTVSITVLSPSIYASANPVSVCIGSATTLTAVAGAPGSAAVGTGATTSTGYPGAFYSLWSNIHTQHLVTAAELTAAGIQAGNLTSMAMNVTSVGTLPLVDLSIKIGTTSATAMTAFVSSAGFTQVYANASYTPVSGANNFAFSVPVYWDGTSNIVVEICHGNPSSSTTMNRTVTTDITSYVSTIKAHVSSATASSVVCGNTTSGIVTYSERPHFTFSGIVAVTGGNPLTYTWNPGGLTGATVSVTPTATTTYTVSAADGVTGCIATRDVLVTVNPIATAPVGTNSAQCGAGVPTASVSDPNGFTTPTFKWYADNVTTTALQSSTSPTYTTSVDATTIFYVSVTNPATGCESTRTAVTVTYTAPAAIVRNPGATVPGCVNQALALSVSSSNLDYVYTWTASPAAGSGIATSVTGAAPAITPTASGTFVYTINAIGGGCNNSTTITATVVNSPTAISISETGGSCVGQIKTLTATGGTVPSSATVGTNNATAQNTTGVPYRTGAGVAANVKTQYLVTAGELSAAGVAPGNITSIGFTTTVATGVMTNLAFKLANVPNTTTALTTTYLTPTFTDVLTIPSYTPVLGLNTHTLTVPFNWDGSSNVVIEVCGTVASGSGCTMATTTTANITTVGNFTTCAVTTGATVAGRPVITFGYASAVTYSWTPQTELYTDATADTPYTGQSINVVYAQATTERTYTYTANTGACSASQSITVSPTALPVFTVADAAICKGGSTTLTASGSGNGYFWSPDTGLSATTGASVVASPLVTTTYTVVATNNTTGCQSTETVTVTVNDPVTITGISPLNPTAIVGQSVTFTATATGSGLTYQWNNQNGIIAGAINPALSVTVTNINMSGNTYYVVVSGIAPCPAETSEVATLTVDTTGITNQPDDTTVCTPNGATFIVEATSEDLDPEEITYGWEVNTGSGFIPVLNGANQTVAGYTFTGADTNTLVLSGTIAGQSNWIFQAVVNGLIYSDPATLVAYAPPVVSSTSFAPQTVCAGAGIASFTVAATGDILGYQWQVSTNGGSNYTDLSNGSGVSGADMATLTLTNMPASANGNLYRVVIDGAAPCADVTPTFSGALTVSNPLIAVQPPVNTNIVQGGTATINATATGASTYQWTFSTTAGGTYTPIVEASTFDGNTYSGTDSTTLTIATSATSVAGNAYYYKLVATSGACSATSNAAQLSINTYCLATYAAGPGTVDHIANVTLGTLSNTTTGSTVAPYYTFYNNLTVPNITQLSNAVVSITFGADTSNYSGVWIDFNHNGIFETTEGVVAVAATPGVGTSGGTTIYTIPVPVTAIPGQTRMRVRGGDDNPLTLAMACGATADVEGDGETEDYIVNIVAAPACSGTPVAAMASASVTSLCISGTSILTASGIPTGITGITTQWYNSAGIIAGATNPTYTTPTLTATETYFIRVNCSNGGGFADSAPVVVTVNNPQIVTTAPATRCGIGTVALGATSSAGSAVEWYTALSGGQPIATGNSFTTPSLNGTTTFYAGAAVPAAGTATVGVGGTTSSTYSGLFYSLYSNLHSQVLFTAAELTASGLKAGNINSVAINVTSAGALPMLDFSLKMGATSATNMSAFVSPAFTTVYTNGSLTPVVGTNTLTFSTPFVWDGTSNVVIELCHGNPASTATMSRTVTMNTTPYVSVIKTHKTTATAGSVICGDTTSNIVTYSTRPQMIFGGQVACSSTRTAVVATVTSAPALTLSSNATAICAGSSSSVITVASTLSDYDTYTWAPVTGVSGTAATGYTFTGTATTVYTLTATNTTSGCANVATFTLNVNPLPVVTITPPSAVMCANDAPLQLSSNNVGSGPAFTELANTLPTTFSLANTTGTGAAALNASYRSEGTGAVLFNTTSFSANVQYAMNANVDLGGASSAQLVFSHIAGLEGASFSYDIGYVEYSTNGGSTWTTFPTSSYAGSGTLITQQGNNTTPTAVNGVIFSAKSYTDWAAQFTSATATPGTAPAASMWKTETINIPAAALTSQFRVRFRQTTDVSGSYYGWLIDNIRVNKVAPSTTTWAPTNGLYTDAAGTTAYTGGNTLTVYAKPLANETYTATTTFTSTGCFASTTATVTVNPTPTAVAPSTMDLCAGVLTTPVALVGTPSGVTFNITGGAAVGLANQTGVTSIPAFTSVPGTATVTVTPTADGCTGTAVTFLIKVSPATVGGTVTGGTTVCGGNASGILTLSGHTGNVVRWESSVSPFSVWTPIVNTATTYTSGTLTQTTQFRAVLQSGTCQEVASAPTTVTVNAVTLGAVSASAVCANTDAVVTLSGMAPNSTSTVAYTRTGVVQTPVTVVANALGVGTFSVMVTGAGQNVVVTSITRTDVTPNCSFIPSSGNSVSFVLSTQCTQVQTCGITLPSIDSPILANIVANVQGYRWRVTTTSGTTAGQVQTLDTSIRQMKLTQLASYGFATQYKVEVATLRSGVWGPFNVGCTISTPAASTSLVNCNQSLASLSDAVYATLVPFAPGYRFRITDPINGANTQVLERSVRDFRMTMITSFVVQYGKAYNVEVAVRNTDGNYMAYSGICQVTTPVFPTTSLQDSQCEDYAVPSNSSAIYAFSYPGAVGYAFQLTGPGLPLAGVEVVKTVRTFTLNDFAGSGLVSGATYNVKVRLIFNIADPAGPYGKTCTIVAPAASKQDVPAAQFNAVAFPNPFAESFNIDVTTSLSQNIGVKVYDMTGRLLETREAKVGDIGTLHVGDRYPSGVYNVVVTQGEHVRTLRVIKR